MSRRSKGSKAPPESTDWREYRPTDARYWFYGGPWVPVEEIPPRGRDAKDVYPLSKGAARVRHVEESLQAQRANLAKETAYYLDLHARGVEALKWEWEKEEILAGRADTTKPNGLHKAFQWCYHNIAAATGDILTYEAILRACGHTPGLFDRLVDDD